MHPAVAYSMHTAFVKFLLCLLIAALPLQGFAAAVRLGCVHGLSSMTQAVESTSPRMPVHQAAQHCDEAAPAADIAASHHTADGGAQGAHHGDHSSCAICSIGAAAPPSSIVPPPALRHTSARAPAPAPLVPGPVPAGLERPPRPIFA